eukprot:scaffold7481_cov88-Cylindrotheca_fusiformis.AAC.1
MVKKCGFSKSAAGTRTARPFPFPTQQKHPSVKDRSNQRKGKNGSEASQLFAIKKILDRCGNDPSAGLDKFSRQTPKKGNSPQSRGFTGPFNR